MRKVLFILLGFFAFTACNSTSKSDSKTEVKQTVEVKTTEGVEVLYFHGKKRCITCNAIETLTKQVLEEINNDALQMKIIDISSPEGGALAEQYEVSWSSLKLNNNGKVTDLTKMGFSYAKNQPEEFKRQLKEVLTQQLSE